MSFQLLPEKASPSSHRSRSRRDKVKGPFETLLEFGRIGLLLPAKAAHEAPPQEMERQRHFHELLEVREMEKRKARPNYDKIESKAKEVLREVGNSGRSVKKHSGMISRVIGIIDECTAVHIRLKKARA